MRLAQILRDAGRQQGIQQPIQQGELAAPAGIVSMTDDLFACGTVENGRDQCWLREGWAAIGKTNLEVVHVVCKMLDELAPCKDGVRYNDLFREV